MSSGLCGCLRFEPPDLAAPEPVYIIAALMTTQNPTDESWNRYWEHGFLTSCRNAFSGNYEGALKAVWTDLFHGLPAGSRILDICTGNGAIAMIANEVSMAGDLEFEIHAIDSAAIRPHDTVKTDRHLLEGIAFHPGTPAEQTGFEDGYFAAVTGQYALEYTDEERCIGEIARVTSAGGHARFVVHHTGSIVMETSREELRNVAIIFDRTDIFGRAIALFEIVAGAATPAERQALKDNPAAETRRNQLNEAAGRLAEALRTSPHPELLQMALDNIVDAYKALDSRGLEAALAHLDNSRQMIKANAERLEDLMAAGRSAEDVRALLDLMVSAGFETEPVQEIRHENGPLMGWLLKARLPG